MSALRAPGLAAYRLAATVAAPLAPLLLWLRARRGKEDPARRAERLGRPSIARPARPLVWLHGASVGETLSLLSLIDALHVERPDLTLLVTSGTVTAAQLLARRLPPSAIHQYIPLDAPAFARRFMKHWRPALAVFVESELWPTLLLQAKASGSRLGLLGARLSPASAAGWARAPAAARTVLGAFDLILAQDDVSRRRIEVLGGRVAGELDLKQIGAPLPYDEAELALLKAAIGARPVLLAASTHAGEDEMLAAVHADLTTPSALLILVPRHPERGAAIAAALAERGLTVARRSKSEPLDDRVQAYVADTLGELGLFYRLADTAVMGGSLTGAVGGHNPLEPARLGLAIVSGADVANFRETYAGLAGADAALMVEDQSKLAAAVGDLLAHPARAREIGLRAKAYSECGDQALDKALAALRPLLPGPEAAP